MRGAGNVRHVCEWKDSVPVEPDAVVTVRPGGAVVARERRWPWKKCSPCGWSLPALPWSARCAAFRPPPVP